MVMRRAWQDCQDVLGFDSSFDEGYRQHIGKPFEVILSELDLPPRLWQDIKRLYFATSSAHLGNIKPYPNIHDVLRELQMMGKKLSVVTSKPRGNAIAIVQNFFDDIDLEIVTPDDLRPGRGKPHPDALLTACDRVGEHPQNTVYIGDMEVDWEAAHAASCSFLYAQWGYGPDTLSDDSVRQLVDVLELVDGRFPDTAPKFSQTRDQLNE